MIRNDSIKAGLRQSSAFIAAFLLFALFLITLGKVPVKVYSDMFLGAFGSMFSIKNTLIQAAPLMLTAMCTLIPAQLGLVVIGNEGALLLGALAAAVTAPLLASFPPAFAYVLTALSAMAVGGIWIALSAVLKQYRGVDITISSLLLYYIGLSLFLFLVEGPFRDPMTLNKPSTMNIPDALKTGLIPGLGVHYGILAGIICCLVIFAFMRFTPAGFSIRITGNNPRVASQLGLPVNRLVILCSAAGGALAGLAGYFEVTAIHFNANASLKSGLGFSGILVAFAARQNALAVIPVALLLGGLRASGGIIQRRHGLADATVNVFEGILFVCILSYEGIRIFRNWKRREG